MRERRWHTRFGMQPPLPWLIAGITAGPILTVAAAYILLCFGPDDILHYIFETEPY